MSVPEKIIVVCLSCFIIAGCAEKASKPLPREIYFALRDSMHIENYDPSQDTANIFDNDAFVPGVDSFENLLTKIDTMWKVESGLPEWQGILKRVAITRKTYTLHDSSVLMENIRVLDSFLLNKDSVQPGVCREKECPLYAEVNKPSQKLYLYLDGELVDSFKVSTGVRGYETPDMNVRASGPVFTRYTSRKFPGGNYQGLGNMPYAVFIRGGYAIHGTTPGNFSKLGRPASHGCIRLHPNNAKLFYELVKRVGLENTWVKISHASPVD